jgi:hypothetical protein
MLIRSILLAATELSAPFPTGYDRITPQVAAERVARCGVGPVTVKPEPDLQQDVLVATGNASVSDEQLACIDKAASFYDVELAPADQLRFDAIREARAATIVTEEARKWLAAHKLLDRLPKYEPGVTSDAIFSRQVEELCNARGALQSNYGHHTLSPEWTQRQFKDSHPNDGPFACLINVTVSTGYEIGFIGNERATP